MQLLAEDPALKEFQSTKGTIQMIKRFGDVLVMAVVAGMVFCASRGFENLKDLWPKSDNLCFHTDLSRRPV